MSSTGAIAKTVARVDQLIKENQYYEAHQAVRTVVARHVRQRKINSAVEVLQKSANLLLQANQNASAGDLVIYMIELFIRDNYEVDSTTCTSICQLLHQFDCHEPTIRTISHDIKIWLKAAQNDSKLHEPFKMEIHGALGQIFARADNIADAEQNLLLGTRDSAKLLGQMLFDYYMDEQKGSKAGLYIARGVLGYLGLANLRDSIVCLDAFLERLEVETAPSSCIQDEHSGMVIKVYSTEELLNFMQLLIISCMSGNPDLYRRLRVRYNSQLALLKGAELSLSKIASFYFGIESPRQNNMLQGLMSGLLGGGI